MIDMGQCLRLKSTRQHKPQLLQMVPQLVQRTIGRIVVEIHSTYITWREEGVQCMKTYHVYHEKRENVDNACLRLKSTRQPTPSEPTPSHVARTFIHYNSEPWTVRLVDYVCMAKS